eukprot:6853630-Ditylum_brightwellii.AAC.1
MFSRILALKESMDKMNKHFSDIEKKVFQGANADNVGESLYDRLISLGKELGLEPNCGTFISKVLSLQQGLSSTSKNVMTEKDVSFAAVSAKMSGLEEDIDKLSLRIDEMQHHVYDQDEQNKATRALSDKLRGLEEELGLTQKDKPLPARICGIEESIVTRIVKLESQAFEQKHVDASNMSLKD